MNDKILFEERKETINSLTGEIENTSSIKTIKVPKEPMYVKMYLQDSALHRALASCNQLLLQELLKIMNYDNEIDLTNYRKKEIATTTGIKIDTINKSLQRLKTATVLIRIGQGTYVMNPLIFAKGEWKNIRKMRKEVA